MLVLTPTILVLMLLIFKLMEAFALEMNRELVLMRPALEVMLVILMLMNELLVEKLVEI